MKNIVVFMLMLGSAALAFAQTNPDTTDRDMIGALREALAPLPLTATTVPSGRLLDAGLILAAPQSYNGNSDAPALGYHDWVRLYGTMLTSELAMPFSLATPVTAVYPHQPSATNDHVVNLAVLDFDYQVLDTAAATNGQIAVSGNQLFPGPAWSPSALLSGHLFAAAPLTQRVNTLTVNFRLPEVLWFRQAGQALPQLIEADLGDGQGWRTIGLGQLLTVTYPSAGSKTLRLRASFAGGLVRHSNSTLTVNSVQAVSGCRRDPSSLISRQQGHLRWTSPAAAPAT